MSALARVVQLGQRHPDARKRIRLEQVVVDGALERGAQQADRLADRARSQLGEEAPERGVDIRKVSARVRAAHGRQGDVEQVEVEFVGSGAEPARSLLFVIGQPLRWVMWDGMNSIRRAPMCISVVHQWPSVSC